MGTMTVSSESKLRNVHGLDPAFSASEFFVLNSISNACKAEEEEELLEIVQSCLSIAQSDIRKWVATDKNFCSEVSCQLFPMYGGKIPVGAKFLFAEWSGNSNFDDNDSEIIVDTDASRKKRDGSPSSEVPEQVPEKKKLKIGGEWIALSASHFRKLSQLR